jgi:phosphoribosyl-AMP cyclohydrolase
LQSKKWSKDNEERHKELKDKWYDGHKEHHNEWKLAYRKKNPFKRALANAAGSFQSKARQATRRHYCKLKDLPFDIDEDFLRDLWEKQGGRCYWLGVEMDLRQSARHPLKATLDRLDCHAGYTKDNVVWASGFANMGRRDTPADEFSEILETVRTSLVNHFPIDI